MGKRKIENQMKNVNEPKEAQSVLLSPQNLVFALQNIIQPSGVELTITKFIWQQCKLELCSFKLKSLTSQCTVLTRWK